MPIAQRTATSGTVASGAGFTISLPAGTTAGDFVLVGVANAGTAGPAAPAGWTAVYSASAGNGQNLAVFSAQYSASLTLAFTNAASLGAWVCDTYWMASRRVAVDTSLAALNTTNNTTLSTGAPVTGAVAGDYEALFYAWSSNATITTVATGATSDRLQANSTTITVALGHNNTTSLGAGATPTAFAHTLSAANTRKTGLGVNLVPLILEDLAGATVGVAVAAATVGLLTRPLPIFPTTAMLGSSMSGLGRMVLGSPLLAPEPFRDLTAAAGGSATAAGVVSRRRALAAASAGVATAAGAVRARRSLVVASAGVAVATGAVRGKRVLSGLSGGVATTSGAVSRKRTLSGTSAGQAFVVTFLDKIQPGAKDITGSSAGRATTTVLVLNRKTAFWVTAAGRATTSGLLTRRVFVMLMARSRGVASAFGLVEVYQPGPPPPPTSYPSPAPPGAAFSGISLTPVLVANVNQRPLPGAVVVASDNAPALSVHIPPDRNRPGRGIAEVTRV